jgi:threonine dehydrogenase-like Zn-dependent dehydrogenase
MPRRSRAEIDTPPVRLVAPPCFVGERGQVTLDVSADLLRRQVTLVGSWTFSKQGQAECAEFIAERNVDVERLFTHRWRLEQAEEAYRLFDTQTTGKAVICRPDVGERSADEP